MKRKVVCFFAVLIFMACNSQSQVGGRYVNHYDAAVANYLILNSDHTYLHYYEKAGTKLSQTGKWDFSREKNQIDLFDFCNYNELGENFKKYEVYILVVDGKYLNDGYDGETRSSFEKE